MQTSFVILSIAAMAVASPVADYWGEPSSKSSVSTGDIQQCGNQQTTVCCNNGDGANAGGDACGDLAGGHARNLGAQNP